MDDTNGLPELPDYGFCMSGSHICGYTAEQMRAMYEKGRRDAHPATVTNEDVDRALDVYYLGGAVRSETDRKRDMRAALESFANKERE